MQSFCLQYRVFGQLDGVTPAPAFRNTRMDQGPPLADPDNVYRFEIQGNLGIIDLGELNNQVLSPPVTPGNRYIIWFEFAASAPSGLGPVGSGLHAAAYLTNNTVPESLKFLDFIVANGTMYARKGYVIPQGQALQLIRLQDPGVEGYFIQFQVFAPNTQEEEALIQQAFCCSANIDTLYQLEP